MTKRAASAATSKPLHAELAKLWARRDGSVVLWQATAPAGPEALIYPDEILAVAAPGCAVRRGPASLVANGAPIAAAVATILGTGGTLPTRQTLPRHYRELRSGPGMDYPAEIVVGEKAYVPGRAWNVRVHGTFEKFVKQASPADLIADLAGMGVELHSLMTAHSGGVPLVVANADARRRVVNVGKAIEQIGRALPAAVSRAAKADAMALSSRTKRKKGSGR